MLYVAHKQQQQAPPYILSRAINLSDKYLTLNQNITEVTPTIAYTQKPFLLNVCVFVHVILHLIGPDIAPKRLDVYFGSEYINVDQYKTDTVVPIVK